MQLDSLINEIKINNNLLNTCVNTKETTAKIEAGYELSKSLGISAPAMFINNRKINIPKDLGLEKILEQFLSE